MRIEDSATIWAHVGTINKISSIGKDIICYGAGCHLVFRNLQTQEKNVYVANSKEKGDGIKCFAGHKLSQFWAFSEACSYPTVHVKNFPDFENICILGKDTDEEYLDLEFSEVSILVTLSGLPNFTISVWNWRTSELLAKTNTDLQDTNQVIKCSLGTPLFLGHLGGGLRIWDVFFCGKKCILTQHNVEISVKSSNKIIDMLWTSEGGLFLLDVIGNIHSVDNDHKVEKIIQYSETYDIEPTFCWYKGGITVAGPNQEIRHYKKSGSWLNDWRLKPPEYIKNILGNNFLIGISKRNIIFNINPTTGEFHSDESRLTVFNEICMVKPLGQYFAALCNNSTIIIYDVETGQTISKYLCKEKTLSIKSNPLFPYLLVGSETGVASMLSVHKPKKLKKLISFHLTKYPIDNFHFHPCGKIFVAASLNYGQFFVLEGLPGSEIQIIGWIDSGKQFLDFMIVMFQDCYRIFAIPLDNKKYIAANTIVRYCIIKDKEMNERTYTFNQNPDLFYNKIIAKYTADRDKTFYIIPINSRSIYEVEIKRSSTEAQVVRIIATGHQIPDFTLKLSPSYALTYGYDGLTIIRSSDFTKNIGIILSHHRSLAGVKKSIIDLYYKYIITLGEENVLICTELLHSTINEKQKKQYIASLNSPEYELLFTIPTTGFSTHKSNEKKTYVEYEREQLCSKEYKICGAKRNQILKEFQHIQFQLQHLLDANLEGPSNEKLELDEFMLDMELYEQKMNHAALIREAVEDHLKQVITRNNEISEWLVNHFLEKSCVKLREIRAIFDDFQVSNFARPTDLAQLEKELVWIEKFRILEKTINSYPFQPWNTAMEEKRSHKSEAARSDVRRSTVIEEEEELEEDETNKMKMLENDIAFCGSEMQRFIPKSPANYHQRELHGFFQAYIQEKVTRAHMAKAKVYFNEHFNQLMAIKEKEMRSIIEKNARLRHIISEINYFSIKKISVDIIDPEWSQTEFPERIKIVTDEEVPITPYISPSEQAILDARAAEAERIRQLLLLDDFRERALMAMMNGVLEIRWEDELKKNVPIPKCMLKKTPEEYKEDDLKAIKEYEQQVKFLNNERERYKNLLYAEFAKVGTQVKDSIKKFNLKLRDLSILRMKVYCSTLQEILISDRIKIDLRSRNANRTRVAEHLIEFEKTESVIHSLTELLNSLHETIDVDCKPPLDALQARDKILEKSFKKDIQDLSSVAQDMAIRIYKKRPKMGLRNLNAPSILLELAKSIINREILPTFNQDCIDFIHALDTLDQYIGVPPQIDEHTFHLICRHRRLRIEYEIRLKGSQTELAESNQTIKNLQKRLAQKKEQLTNAKAKIYLSKDHRTKRRYNTPIQIILPHGLVEIPITGSLSDFKDAILISRHDVEKINEIILTFGEKKLHQMNVEMSFHRQIMATEWKHKYLRMIIEDFLEKIEDVKSIKMTKEIMSYLKTKRAGIAGEQLSYDTQIVLIKTAHETKLKEIKARIANIKSKIKALKIENRNCDKQISELNVDVCEINLLKDHDLDIKIKEVMQERMETFMKRSELVNQISHNCTELMMLQTELELIRLRTFPTLKYKVIS